MFSRTVDAVEIVDALPEHSKDIIKCMNAVMKEQVFLIGERYPYSSEMLADMLRSGIFKAYVAIIYGRVVGVVMLKPGTTKKTSHVAYLSIVVLKNYRGAGVGKRLMKAAIQWARRNGIRKLSLEVFASNERAIEFYKSCGFVEEARLKKHYSINDEYVDSVFMYMWLD